MQDVVGFYNDETKIMVINIPKNASTSVRASLGAFEHSNLKNLKDYEKYRTVIVIRNPLDRISSQYNEVMKRKSELTRSKGFFNMEEGSREKFIEFLKEINRGFFDIHTTRQVDSILDSEGNIFTADYVLLFDTLSEDFDKMKQELCINVSLIHQLKSNHTSYLEMAQNDEEIRSLILDIYSEDLELYNKIKNERK